MNRCLTIDIGAGTMDILYWEEGSGLHYKAVTKSPVVYLAERTKRLPGNLLITGSEMGGGPLKEVLRQRAEHARVIMSASSSATLHHDPQKVGSWGIKVVPDEEAERLKQDKGYAYVILTDLEPYRLERIVEAFGIPLKFDVVGICAQDHGIPPEGVSHLDFRHTIFTSRLDEHPTPHAFLYRDKEVPDYLNRLKSLAKEARILPADEVYLMDSGMAAILGASMDPEAAGKQKILVMDIATSHTLGAALEGGEICGYFEYHTRDITLARLESLLRELADGSLDHKQILREGGHGAYVRKAFGFENAEALIATGPQRSLVSESSLPIVFGAPLGDNMMTGAAGVLQAIRRIKGLGPPGGPE